MFIVNSFLFITIYYYILFLQKIVIVVDLQDFLFSLPSPIAIQPLVSNILTQHGSCSLSTPLFLHFTPTPRFCSSHHLFSARYLFRMLQFYTIHDFYATLQIQTLPRFKSHIKSFLNHFPTKRLSSPPLRHIFPLHPTYTSSHTSPLHPKLVFTVTTRIKTSPPLQCTKPFSTVSRPLLKNFHYLHSPSLYPHQSQYNPSFLTSYPYSTILFFTSPLLSTLPFQNTSILYNSRLLPHHTN